jgi:hypothetical protein
MHSLMKFYLFFICFLLPGAVLMALGILAWQEILKGGW